MRTLPLALALRRLGWPSITVVILSLLLLVLLSMVLHLEQRIATGRAQLNGHVISAEPALPSASKTPMARYDAFKAGLRPRGEIPALLKTIFSEARRHRLQLNQMDYRLERHEHGEYLTYHMTAPIKGTYGDVRLFVQALLVQAPDMALQGIEFRRDDAKSPLAEARLRFLVYLGEQNI